MISQVAGTVLDVSASSCVVDVGGIGLQVLSTPAALATLQRGHHTRLHTHLVVREDSLTLFGFISAEEGRTFEVLQSVQGVGPRLALAVLAVLSPQQLQVAVSSGDRKALERVPGIGAKVASRLLLELGGKLTAPTNAPPSVADARDQVEQALVSLGWNGTAAADAVVQVAPEPIDDAQVSTVLKSALRILGGTRG